MTSERRHSALPTQLAELELQLESAMQIAEQLSDSAPEWRMDRTLFVDLEVSIYRSLTASAELSRRYGLLGSHLSLVHSDPSVSIELRE